MGQILSTFIVTSPECHEKVKKIQYGNQECVTLIQAVQSGGEAIPLYMMVASKTHTESWYHNNLSHASE